MPKIIFVENDNTEHNVDSAVDTTVMEAAIENGVPGILAECGGSLACATCHVYVDDNWISKMSEKSSLEEDMLDFAEDVRPNSRLCCQLRITSEMDGLIVRIPRHQG